MHVSTFLSWIFGSNFSVYSFTFYMPIVSLLVAALLSIFILLSMYFIALYLPNYMFSVCNYLLLHCVLLAVSVASLNYFILYYLMFI